MFKVEVKVDKKLFGDITDKALNGPKEVFVQYGNAVAAIGDRAVKTLSTEPGKPRYPIRWSTERQRRAYFATDGFGRGIPYKRTGKYADAWQWNARTTATGGIFEIQNTALTQRKQPLEQYVQGARQQPFHKDTGWVSTQPTLDNAATEAELLLSTMWQDIMGEL